MGKTMKMIRTAIVAGILTLISTSAFAGNETTITATQSNDTRSVVTRQAHVIKAPVLLSAKTKTRRVTRVVVEPVETLVARDASMNSDSSFVFKRGKKVNTKMFSPTDSNSKSIPNLFQK